MNKLFNITTVIIIAIFVGFTIGTVMSIFFDETDTEPLITVNQLTLSLLKQSEQNNKELAFLLDKVMIEKMPEPLIAVNQLALSLQQSEQNNKELVDTLDKIIKEKIEMQTKMVEASKMILELVRIIEDLQREKSA